MDYINLVTCVDSKFSKYAKELKKTVDVRDGIRLYVYDIGGGGVDFADFVIDVHDNYDDFDANNNIVTNHKPICIKHFLQNVGEGCLYIDADCLVVDDININDFVGCDVAVTPRALREQKPHIMRNGEINAGVMYFSANTGVINFIDRWERMCRDGVMSDQKAICELLKEQIEFEKTAQDQTWDGLTIRFLSADEYNDVTCKTGRIFHCKSVARRRSKYYWYVFFSRIVSLFPRAIKIAVSFNRRHKIVTYRRRG